MVIDGFSFCPRCFYNDNMEINCEGISRNFKAKTSKFATFSHNLIYICQLSYTLINNVYDAMITMNIISS